MKKNYFLRLFGLMMIATALTTFTACSGDDDNDDQSKTTAMYDDLDFLQKSLCTIDDAGNLVRYNTGVILYENEPQHLYIGVDNIEEAATIFASWLSPDVKLADITPSVRELTAQLTDKQGKPQGTIYFRAGTGPIVAQVTASADTQLKFIGTITFLLKSAWPQNSGENDDQHPGQTNTNLGNEDDLGISGDPDDAWGR